MASSSSMGFSYVDKDNSGGLPKSDFYFKCNECNEIAKRCKDCRLASCKNKHLVAVTNGVDAVYEVCNTCECETSVKDSNKKNVYPVEKPREKSSCVIC